MFYRFQVFVFLLFVSVVSQGQDFKSFVLNKKWILVTEKVDTAKTLKFVAYDKAKISLNTMIWDFQSNGRLEYDYQSDEDIDACLGVDFLDLDVDVCTWRYNPSTQTLQMTLKGGFASIDDFILKNEYTFSNSLDEYEMPQFELSLKRKIFFKDLTKN
ncbi:hypothetical protein EGI22_23360 [Lacihabitans sp. LS3-19]|uniref:hypothetical protein n=1 Tax=Lacihabitans sp. LS3-19 TaxID=2487335 RepID=UPI0020CC6ED3|nr:hypothetical protein [Lacihabitans sp. LS3-19]MCP9770853.1 hypothetical protein [Lacihabitans sp. LS3-19]